MSRTKAEHEMSGTGCGRIKRLNWSSKRTFFDAKNVILDEVGMLCNYVVVPVTVGQGIILSSVSCPYIVVK